MRNTDQITHYLFNSHIRINSQKSNGAFFGYEVEELMQESFEIKNILAALSAKSDELFCWFTIDQQFNRKESMVIESHLEKTIADYLLNEWKVNVLLISLDQNTSFNTCLKQLDLLFMPLSKRYPNEIFAHLSLHSKNGLFSQAFIIEAIRHFGERYRSIIWDGSELTTNQYDIQVDQQSWLSLFKAFIQDYDYYGALELLDDLNDDSLQVKAIGALLQSQVKRMNFAFDESFDYLNEVVTLMPFHETLQETATIIRKLINDNQQEKELERIVELFRQIDVYIETDDVASFLVRFYRAREAVLFFLRNYARTTNNDVKIERVKRSSIQQVFEELEELYDEWEIDGHFGAYFFLKSQNTYNILQYRNRSFIGHARNKIEAKDLWLSFAGTTSKTIAKVKKRFQMDSDLLLRDLGVQVDDNFYAINLLLLQLVDELKKEGVDQIEEIAYNL